MAEKLFYENLMEEYYVPNPPVKKFLPAHFEAAWSEDRSKHWVMPEFDKDPDHVKAGKYAFKIATRHAAHSCIASVQLGVIKPNSKIRFEIWGAGLSLDHDGTKGGHGLQVGIGPTGQTPVWSPWVSQQQGWDGGWHRFEMDYVALTNDTTIYCKSQCDYAVDNNVGWFDALRVWVDEGGHVGPAPGVQELRDALEDIFGYAMERLEAL